MPRPPHARTPSAPAAAASSTAASGSRPGSRAALAARAARVGERCDHHAAVGDGELVRELQALVARPRAELGVAGLVGRAAEGAAVDDDAASSLASGHEAPGAIRSLGPSGLFTTAGLLRASTETTAASLTMIL